MKNLAVTLWMFQLIAALVMLVAAAIKTESILITGPALSLIGLLLGLATCPLQSPAALVFALSTPRVARHAPEAMEFHVLNRGAGRMQLFRKPGGL